jgi:hypothetical protein
MAVRAHALVRLAVLGGGAGDAVEDAGEVRVVVLVQPRRAQLGFGRAAVSEREVPNVFVNLV